MSFIIMSFINEEEETYEFLNSKTLNGSFINDDDNGINIDTFKYYWIYNEEMLEGAFKHSFPNVDYNSLDKINDYINYEISIYDKVNKCKYIYNNNNRCWTKINI